MENPKITDPGTKMKGDAAFIHRVLNHEFDYFDGPARPLDVEVRDGKVVAVWYGCLMLPFEQTEPDSQRAQELILHVYDSSIHGIGIRRGNGS